MWLLQATKVIVLLRAATTHGNSDALSRRPCERGTETDCQQYLRATQTRAAEPISSDALPVDSSIARPKPLRFLPLHSLVDRSSDLSPSTLTPDFASDQLEAPELPVSPDEATHTSPTNGVTARTQVLGITAEPT